MHDLLQIRNITKGFAGNPALRGVSFSVPAGEIVCLLGPSGCGKTTLLRIVAGLEDADEGTVLFEGNDLSDVPPYERHFGLMFQDFALFPHKNVFDNVAFGLRMKDDNSSTEDSLSIRDTVGGMLELVGLTGFEKRNVSELSGGEAQRVALARSLAPHPRFLMLDEPLGSLDRATRERLMVEVRDILRRVGVTALYVTHDQSEAFSIADRAIVMDRGRVEQEGTPESLYRRPATEFVARFLGLSNLVPGMIVSPDLVECPWGRLAADTSGLASGARVTVLVRPEAARLTSGVQADASEDAVPSQASQVRGRLVSKTFRDGRYRIRLATDGEPELAFDLDGVRPLAVAVGENVTLAIDAAGIVLLPAEP